MRFSLSYNSSVYDRIQKNKVLFVIGTFGSIRKYQYYVRHQIEHCEILVKIGGKDHVSDRVPPLSSENAKHFAIVLDF